MASAWLYHKGRQFGGCWIWVFCLFVCFEVCWSRTVSGVKPLSNVGKSRWMRFNWLSWQNHNLDSHHIKMAHPHHWFREANFWQPGLAIEFCLHLTTVSKNRASIIFIKISSGIGGNECFSQDQRLCPNSRWQQVMMILIIFLPVSESTVPSEGFHIQISFFLLTVMRMLYYFEVFYSSATLPLLDVCMYLCMYVHGPGHQPWALPVLGKSSAIDLYPSPCLLRDFSAWNQRLHSHFRIARYGIKRYTIFW